MSTIRALLAISTVAICGVAISGAEGCAEPGVIETAPAPGFGKDAGTKPPVNKKDASNGTTGEPSNADEGNTDSTDTTDNTDDEPPVKLDGGTKPGTSKPDASTKPVTVGKDAGDDTTVDDKPDASKPSSGGKLPACPSSWMCSDPGKALTDMGIDGKVTDQDGNAIPAACGNGGLVMCSDPKDPKGSCPKELTDPVCAHISLGALGDFQSCAQRCDL